MTDFHDYDPEDFDEEGNRRPILVADYCNCGQHVDEHDGELCQMRLDAYAEGNVIIAAGRDAG